jgi:glutamyl-tRNA reductase
LLFGWHPAERTRAVLVVVGLNQRSASVADRELLAAPAREIEADLAGFVALGGIEEVAVLSTCHRVELYAATRCPAAAVVALRQALNTRARRELPLFQLQGADAFRHLTRVASSLESAILGEPQILGQVKGAFQAALDSGAAGPELTRHLNHALQAAKRVRAESAIGRSGVSWGHAAATLAEKVIGPLAGRRVVVVGAGEMARLSAQHLRERGALVTVLNRTLEHARALAAEVGAEARPLEALEEELLRSDVVVSAAPAAAEAFHPEAMARLTARRRRPLVMVDLAVPRAIPAESGRVRDVYLCDVDDLERVMKASLEERGAAIAHAERILHEELARWARAEAERGAAPLIAEMRQRAATIARAEVERTLRRVGVDPELERRLDAMAGSIVSKLLHQPSARLRRAACEGGEGEALVAAACEIFALGARDNAA